jgi:hypothetical protein
VRMKFEEVDHRPDRRVSGEPTALRLAHICCVITRGSLRPSLPVCISFLGIMVTSEWEGGSVGPGPVLVVAPESLVVFVFFFLPEDFLLGGTVIQAFSGGEGVGATGWEGGVGVQSGSFVVSFVIFLGGVGRVDGVESLSSKMSTQSAIRFRSAITSFAGGELAAGGSGPCL